MEALTVLICSLVGGVYGQDQSPAWEADRFNTEIFAAIETI